MHAKRVFVKCSCGYRLQTGSIAAGVEGFKSNSPAACPKCRRTFQLIPAQPEVGAVEEMREPMFG